MRIPIPLVFIFCTTLIAGLWWHYTRHMDFLTPPNQFTATFHPESTTAPILPPTITPPPEEKITPPEAPPSTASAEPVSPPSITIRQFHTTPPYSNSQLANIAAQHETQKEWQLALLAWERILDESDSNEAQRTEAIHAIQRLKPLCPLWNADPSQAIPLHLHAQTTAKHIQTLSPVLHQIAIDIEKASAGIIKIHTHISANSQLRTTSVQLPYTICLSGHPSPLPSTQTPHTSSSPLTLKDDIIKKLYLSIESIIAEHQLARPPLHWPTHLDNPSRALYTYVTRYTWQQLAHHLSKSPKP